MSREIQVATVVPHSLIQRGIEAVINDQSNLHLVYTANRYDELTRLCHQNKPDVLLLLTSPAETHHLCFLEAYAQVHQLPILALSLALDESHFYTLLKLGVRGYFFIGDDAELLGSAIRTITKGNHWYSPTIAAHFVHQKLATPIARGSYTHLAQLTGREVNILQMITQGWSNRKMSEILGVSERTIRFHMRNIYDKLEVDTRAEAIVWAMKAKLSYDF